MADDIKRVVISVESRGVQKTARNIKDLERRTRSLDDSLRHSSSSLDKATRSSRTFGASASKEFRRAEVASRKMGSALDRSLTRSSLGFQGLIAQVGQFRAAMVALGAVMAVKKFIEFADIGKNMNNMLVQVTESSKDLEDAWDGLFKAAQDSYASIESTVDGFTRLKYATGQLGLTQAELIDTTRTLGMAVALTGASAQDAERGMVQFYQGLSKGTLGGQDLKSVIETLSPLAARLSKELGFEDPIQGLRDAAEAGELTTKRLVAAIQSMKAEVEKDFADMAPTVERSLVRLRNSTIGITKAFDEATGVSSLLSKTIVGLSSFIDLLAENIDTLIAYLKQFTPWTRVASFGISSIGHAFSELVQWAGKAKSAVEEVQEKTSTPSKTNDIVDTGFSKFLDLLKEENRVLSLTTNEREAYNLALKAEEALKRSLTDTEKGQLTTYVQTAKLLQEQSKILGSLNKGDETRLLRRTALQNLRARELITEKQYNALMKEFEGPLSFKDQLLRDILGKEEHRVNVLKALSELLKEGAISQHQYNNALSGFKDGLIGFKDYLGDLERENALLSMNRSERELALGLSEAEAALKRPLTGGEGALLTQQLEMNKALRKEADILGMIKGPARERLEAQAALQSLLEKNKITQQEFNQSLIDLDLSGPLSGIQLFAKKAGEYLQHAFDRGTDALVQFARTGKLSIQSLLADLAELAFRMAMQDVFKMGLKSLGIGVGAGGGSMFGALPGFSTGGSFTVGGSGGTDSKLVAFRATPGETVDVRTPSQQRDQAPQVHIVNITDPSASLDVLSSADGQNMILNVIERNPHAVRKLLGVA